MNEFSAVFYSRNFGSQLSFGGRHAIPVRWGKNVLGGPSFAQLEILDPDESTLLSIANNLRSPVRIYDNTLGEVVWSGFISSVDGPVGKEFGLSAGADFDSMANRIRIGYDNGISGVMSAETQYTSWAEDLGSQAEFGIKELELRLTNTSQAVAEAMVQSLLDQLKFPQVSISIDAGNTGGSDGIQVNAKGWIHSLDWRYFSNPVGYIAHLAGKTSKPFGSAAVPKVMQKFYNDSSAFQAGSISVKLALSGLPGDITVSIYNIDGSDNPTTLVASVTIAESSLSENAAWIKSDFASPPTIAASTYYAIVFEVASGDASNYALVTVDDDEGYTDGMAREYNGSSWSTPVDGYDILFQIDGTEETTSIMNTAISTYGQYISHISRLVSSGLYETPYRSGETTVLANIIDLAVKGTSNNRRIMLDVDHNRIITISEEPAYSLQTAYRLAAGNLVFDSKNRPIRLSTCPVGFWMTVQNIMPSIADFRWLLNSNIFFIESSEFEAASGVWKPGPRGIQTSAQILGGGVSIG